MSDIKSTSLDKFKSLIEINTRINLSYGDSRALLASILESVMCMVQCEAASLLLVNREDGRLHFSIALGPKGAEVKKIEVDKNSIAGWVAQNKQSVVINDVGSDPRFNSSVQDKTDYISKNMIAFPMCVGDECAMVSNSSMSAAFPVPPPAVRKATSLSLPISCITLGEFLAVTT